ncbi:MAG: FkbM family methyltransferase [Solirubrobacteraceae bacterium]
MIRRLVRKAWDATEAMLDNRLGRPVLRVLSGFAIRLQSRGLIRVHWDGAWWYHWPEGVVVSDRALITRARPQDGARYFTWDYQPQDGDTVIDIGAGVGEQLHGYVGDVGPSGRVIAVEAHPRLCELLERLCEANGWQNVQVMNAAITDAPGTVSLTDERISIANDIFRQGTIDVPAMPLSQLLDDCGVDHVDFLKMNIEGAETLVLESVDPPLAQRLRHIVISCHDFIGRPTKAPVRQRLQTLGYDVKEYPEPTKFVSVSDFLYASRGAAARDTSVG